MFTSAFVRQGSQISCPQRFRLYLDTLTSDITCLLNSLFKSLHLLAFMLNGINIRTPNHYCSFLAKCDCPSVWPQCYSLLEGVIELRLFLDRLGKILWELNGTGSGIWSWSPAFLIKHLHSTQMASSTYGKDAHTMESLGVGDVGVPSSWHTELTHTEGKQVTWPQLPTAQLLLMPLQVHDQQNQLGIGAGLRLRP